jgi:hypothetical protein
MVRAVWLLKCSSLSAQVGWLIQGNPHGLGVPGATLALKYFNSQKPEELFSEFLVVSRHLQSHFGHCYQTL